MGREKLLPQLPSTPAGKPQQSGTTKGKYHSLLWLQIPSTPVKAKLLTRKGPTEQEPTENVEPQVSVASDKAGTIL